MGASKTEYCRNKEDVAAALGIVKSDQFAKLIIYAKAEFNEYLPSTEQCRGAELFERILRTMADVDSAPPTWPDGGLDHNLEVPNRDVKAAEEKKS